MRWLPPLAILLVLLTRFGANQTWLIPPCLALIMLAFLFTGAGRQAAAVTLEPVLLVGSTVVAPLLVARLLHRLVPASQSEAGGTGARLIMRLLWAVILYVSASKVGLWFAHLTYENLPQRLDLTNMPHAPIEHDG